jgi:Ca2+-binding EF-hand superfamily protein
MASSQLSVPDSISSTHDVSGRRTKEEEILKLQIKADELRAMIAAIDDSLKDQGLDLDSAKEKNGKQKSSMPQSGIRIDGKLSFRGKQMAEEYFRRLDENEDGFLDFSEFRGDQNHCIAI